MTISYYVRQGTHTESIDDQFIFELPDNWEWCSLLNIAKIDLGKTLDSAKNTGTNHPYLRSVNVRWNEVDLSDLKEMRFEPEELDRYTVRRNDLLICEGGDVGRSCVWTDEREILYQNALHRVRFYGECNPFYFMYYMMYYESRGIIKALCKGVTIKHLMDVKTLSAVLGHVSSAVSLNVYAHTTTKMQQEAAVTIDRRISKSKTLLFVPGNMTVAPPKQQFTPKKSARRKSGTGCISELNDHLYEGKFSITWIDGKKRTVTTYATTREECEEQLAEVIKETKEELDNLKKALPPKPPKRVKILYY